MKTSSISFCLSFCAFLMSGLFVAQAKDSNIDSDTSSDTNISASISSVTYLGNEGILFSDGKQKVLFDPFFHNVYGQYQAVPEDIQQAILSNTPPYDDIDLILISHAHGDHFTAETVAQYLKANKAVSLVGPTQATDKVLEVDAGLKQQLVGIELEFGDEPITTKLNDIKIDSVRIPHAGWPSRKEISNLVHRVSLNNKTSIIHMGDADPRDQHFAPFASHWSAQTSDAAFPPYWFFISPEGPTILKDRVNAKQSVGIHVPVEVPENLKASGAAYFSKPGSKIDLP